MLSNYHYENIQVAVTHVCFWKFGLGNAEGGLSKKNDPDVDNTHITSKGRLTLEIHLVMIIIKNSFISWLIKQKQIINNKQIISIKNINMCSWCSVTSWYYLISVTWSFAAWSNCFRKWDFGKIRFCLSLSATCA